MLDRALSTCRRLGDPQLLHEGCVLAWNTGLPLLEPHLRRHVHRTFSTAALCLEEMDSPMQQVSPHCRVTRLLRLFILILLC